MEQGNGARRWSKDMEKRDEARGWIKEKEQSTVDGPKGRPVE